MTGDNEKRGYCPRGVVILSDVTFSVTLQASLPCPFPPQLCQPSLTGLSASKPTHKHNIIQCQLGENLAEFSNIWNIGNKCQGGGLGAVCLSWGWVCMCSSGPDQISVGLHTHCALLCQGLGPVTQGFGYRGLCNPHFLSPATIPYAVISAPINLLWKERLGWNVCSCSKRSG